MDGNQELPESKPTAEPNAMAGLVQSLLAGLASEDDDAEDASNTGRIDPKHMLQFPPLTDEPGDEEDADWERE